jgi:hypothetical protein
MLQKYWKEESSKGSALAVLLSWMERVIVAVVVFFGLLKTQNNGKI